MDKLKTDPDYRRVYMLAAQIKCRARKRAGSQNIYKQLKSVEAKCLLMAKQMQKIADWCHRTAEYGNLEKPNRNEHQNSEHA